MVAVGSRQRPAFFRVLRIETRVSHNIGAQERTASSARTIAAEKVGARRGGALDGRAWAFELYETGRRSRSAINPGPVGRHPSFFCVCALEAGISREAKWASQPK
jgi:hypothetical protein